MATKSDNQDEVVFRTMVLFDKVDTSGNMRDWKIGALK
jgi:hypothetical protein